MTESTPAHQHLHGLGAAAAGCASKVTCVACPHDTAPVGAGGGGIGEVADLGTGAAVRGIVFRLASHSCRHRHYPSPNGSAAHPAAAALLDLSRGCALFSNTTCVCVQGLFWQDFPPKDDLSPEVHVQGGQRAKTCRRCAGAGRPAGLLAGCICAHATYHACPQDRHHPPPPQHPTNPQSSPFQEELDGYVRELRLPLPEARRTLGLIAGHDFSAARAHIVASGGCVWGVGGLWVGACGGLVAGHDFSTACAHIVASGGGLGGWKGNQQPCARFSSQ